jgi:GcrA cell cycle regulator
VQLSELFFPCLAIRRCVRIHINNSTGIIEMANADWTPSILSKMKAYLAKGMSTAEIGAKIGMSKNAVVGKLNRLGWNAKSQNSPMPKAKSPKPKAQSPKPVGKIKKAVSRQLAEKTKKPAAPVKKVPAIKTPVKKASGKPDTKTLAAHQRIIQHSLEMANMRPDQCRWPIGDPDSAGFHFCGEKVFAGKPYCYEHCRQAYQFTQPPKKKEEEIKKEEVKSKK